MLSAQNENVLTIYPVYIKDQNLKFFTESKFRDIDSSDIPGVGLKVFNILLGLFAGLKLYGPIFSNSFGVNLNYLNMSLTATKQLLSRGKIFTSDQFPPIDSRYVTYSIDDFVNAHKDEFHPKDNPFDKHGLTHNPFLKDGWSQVYIVSLCSEEELLEKGLNDGYLTFTQNDAIQLCKLICDEKFPAPARKKDAEADLDLSSDTAVTDSDFYLDLVTEPINIPGAKNVWEEETNINNSNNINSNNTSPSSSESLSFSFSSSPFLFSPVKTSSVSEEENNLILNKNYSSSKN